jgi:hypothetical protein
MMDCKECQEKLLDYHRRLLLPKDAGDLEDHLRSCVECAGRVREAGLLPQLLSCDAQAPSRAVDAVLALARSHLARQNAPVAPPQPARQENRIWGSWWGGAKNWLDRLLARPAGLAWAAAALLVLAGGYVTLTQLERGRSGSSVATGQSKSNLSASPRPLELAQVAAPALGELEELLRRKAQAREAAQREYPALRVMATLGGGAFAHDGKLRGLLAVMTPTTAQGKAGIKGALVILDVQTGLCVGPQDLGDLLLLRRVTIDRSSPSLTKIDLAKDCLLLARPLKTKAPQGLQFYWAPGVTDAALAGSFERINLAGQPLGRQQKEVWAVGLKEDGADAPWVIEETELKQTREGKIMAADPEAPVKWPLGAILLDGNGSAAGWLIKNEGNSNRVVPVRELNETLEGGNQAAREALMSISKVGVITNDQITTQATMLQPPGAAARQLEVKLSPGGYQITMEGQESNHDSMILQSKHPGVIFFNRADHP